MSKACHQLIDDAAYYMDGSPLPGLGISHWRDDPIVAWFDEFCRDQFESGTSPRADHPVLPTKRQGFFTKIIRALPWMARTVAALSEWVRFAEELDRLVSRACCDVPAELNTLSMKWAAMFGEQKGKNVSRTHAIDRK